MSAGGIVVIPKGERVVGLRVGCYPRVPARGLRRGGRARRIPRARAARLEDVPCTLGAPATRVHTAWDALGRRRSQLAALRALSIDLTMAAGAEDAELVHSHTWYANLGGHLAKLLYDIPHVATVHRLEPLRPWKAEQLGGGYAALELVREDRAGGGRRRDRRLARHPRRHLATLSGGRSRRGSTSSTTGSTPRSTARHAPPMCSSVTAWTRDVRRSFRRPDHAAEGRAVSAARRPQLRSRRAARAVRGRARHAGDRRRGRARGRRAASRARRSVVDRGDAPQARGHPAVQPRHRVRLPVDLRAAGS